MHTQRESLAQLGAFATLRPVLDPHLYFVSFAIAGGTLGASLILGGRARGPARALQSYIMVLLVPFALGFGAAGIASEAVGATRWPYSLYHASAAGAVLAGLSLLVGLLRRDGGERSGEGHVASTATAPGIEHTVQQRDEARRDQHE